MAFHRVVHRVVLKCHRQGRDIYSCGHRGSIVGRYGKMQGTLLVWRKYKKRFVGRQLVFAGTQGRRNARRHTGIDLLLELGTQIFKLVHFANANSIGG